MKALLTVVAIWLLSPALVLAWVHADAWLEGRAEDKRRAEQDREITPEWLAILAATEATPVYDALVCEQIELAEGWVS